MSANREVLIVGIKGTNQAVVVGIDNALTPDISKTLHKASELVLYNYLTRFFQGEDLSVLVSDDVAYDFMDRNSDHFIHYIENKAIHKSINHEIKDIKNRPYNINLTIERVFMMESSGIDL